MEEESSSGEELDLSDHSSDDLEDDYNEHENLPSLEGEPRENYHIPAEFDTTVGVLTKDKDNDGAYEVSYLRKKEKTAEFFFPQVQDVTSVSQSHPSKANRMWYH